jgi:hypothetical protein
LINLGLRPGVREGVADASHESGNAIGLNRDQIVRTSGLGNTAICGQDNPASAGQRLEWSEPKRLAGVDVDEAIGNRVEAGQLLTIIDVAEKPHSLLQSLGGDASPQVAFGRS